MKITDYQELSLEMIEIGTYQARVRHVDKNINDLARSMRTVGLLEPIVVAKVADDKYEVITGQRRFLAAQRLGWSTIRAGILDTKPEGDIAKAISLTENMVREDMSTTDYIDACTELYKRYGSLRAVSEELGLPMSRVSQYVKYEQLAPELKKFVDDGSLDLKTALRAQKAASDENGEIDTKAAVAFAEEMKSMSGAQQKQLEKVAEHHRGASPEEVIEAGRKQPKVKQVIITIGSNTDSALSQFAQEEGTNRDDAAVSLIESGLTDRGYMDSE